MQAHRQQEQLWGLLDPLPITTDLITELAIASSHLSPHPETEEGMVSFLGSVTKKKSSHTERVAHLHGK